MRRSPSRRPRSHDEENPYWISFSDLMTALLTVFILAVVVLVLQLTDKQQALADEQQQLADEQQTAEQQRGELTSQVESLQHAEDVRAEMVEEIAATLERKGIEVHVSEDSSVLNIPTSQLGFDASSYEIRPGHRDTALTIGRVIAQALEKDRRYQYLDTVFVEGHTDNVPFDGLEGTGNWGLSTFRAISLWRLWQDDLPASDRLGSFKAANGSPLFSVSGYGSTRPLTAAQKTDTDRAENRRIDIRFTVVHPTAEQLAEILDLDDGTTK